MNCSVFLLLVFLANNVVAELGSIKFKLRESGLNKALQSLLEEEYVQQIEGMKFQDIYFSFDFQDAFWRVQISRLSIDKITGAAIKVTFVSPDKIDVKVSFERLQVSANVSLFVEGVPPKFAPNTKVNATQGELGISLSFNLNATTSTVEFSVRDCSASLGNAVFSGEADLLLNIAYNNGKEDFEKFLSVDTCSYLESEINKDFSGKIDAIRKITLEKGQQMVQFVLSFVGVGVEQESLQLTTQIAIEEEIEQNQPTLGGIILPPAYSYVQWSDMEILADRNFVSDFLLHVLDPRTLFAQTFKSQGAFSEDLETIPELQSSKVVMSDNGIYVHFNISVSIKHVNAVEAFFLAVMDVKLPVKITFSDQKVGIYADSERVQVQYTRVLSEKKWEVLSMEKKCEVLKSYQEKTDFTLSSYKAKADVILSITEDTYGLQNVEVKLHTDLLRVAADVRMTPLDPNVIPVEQTIISNIFNEKVISLSDDGKSEICLLDKFIGTSTQPNDPSSALSLLVSTHLLLLTTAFVLIS